MALRVTNNYKGFTLVGVSKSLPNSVTRTANFSGLRQTLAQYGASHIKHPTILVLGPLATFVSPLGLSDLA